MTRLRTAAVLVGALAIAAPAIGAQHESSNPAVKARQAHMQLYAFNLGQLGAMAKGEAEYDADAATAAAADLVALSGMDQTAYLADGTSSDEVDGSHALPALFENKDDYKTLQTNLHDAAMAMETAAGESAEAIGAQMGALGGACGACHKKYRVSDD